MISTNQISFDLIRVRKLNELMGLLTGLSAPTGFQSYTDVRPTRLVLHNNGEPVPSPVESSAFLDDIAESDHSACCNRCCHSVVYPSVRLYVCMYVCRLSHSCTLLKLLDGMRCHLAWILLWFQVTLY